jgi:hypothetical protein
MVLASAANVGDVVYITAGGTGSYPTVAQAAGGAAGTARGHGVIVAIGAEGALTGAAGDGVSVVTYGPVTGIAGTPGALGYVSNTAGRISDAAGTTSHIMGRQESANVFFVHPAVA